MTPSCRSCASCERELSAVRLELQAVVRERDAFLGAFKASEAALDALTTDEMLAFHKAHGLAALLDHLGLDGLGNEVVALRLERDQYRDALERVYRIYRIDIARAALSRERKDTE